MEGHIRAHGPGLALVSNLFVKARSLTIAEVEPGEPEKTLGMAMFDDGIPNP